MSIVGVDPGLHGAMAFYEPRTGLLEITDMPTFNMTVGARTRERIDAVALLEYFELAKMQGATLVVIEQVGGRPKQGNMFPFGYSIGLLYMACIAARIPIEAVPSRTWKKLMRVPGKKDDEGNIISRADELFPDHRNLWRGPKGGPKLDRAEAALIAKYAADFMLRIADDVSMDTWLERWRKSEEAQ